MNVDRLRDLPITEACAALAVGEELYYYSLYTAGLHPREYNGSHRSLSNLLRPSAYIPDPAWEMLWDKLLITADISFYFDKEADDWNGVSPAKNNVTKRMLKPNVRVRIVTITENLNIGITDKMDQDTADAFVAYKNLVNWKFKRIK